MVIIGSMWLGGVKEERRAFGRAGTLTWDFPPGWYRTRLRRLEAGDKQEANAGVLRFAQNDSGKQTMAKWGPSTALRMRAQNRQRRNAEVLRLRGSHSARLASLRMTAENKQRRNTGVLRCAQNDK